MANPFEKSRPRSGFMDVANLAVRLGTLKQGRDRIGLMKEDVALRGRAQDLQKSKNVAEYGAG